MQERPTPCPRNLYTSDLSLVRNIAKKALCTVRSGDYVD
jgi:hypothetical protein